MLSTSTSWKVQISLSTSTGCILQMVDVKGQQQWLHFYLSKPCSTFRRALSYPTMVTWELSWTTSLGLAHTMGMGRLELTCKPCSINFQIIHLRGKDLQKHFKSTMVAWSCLWNAAISVLLYTLRYFGLPWSYMDKLNKFKDNLSISTVWNTG